MIRYDYTEIKEVPPLVGMMAVKASISLPTADSPETSL
jgi:hypothetical protein